MKRILLAITFTLVPVTSHHALAGWRAASTPVKIVGGNGDYYMHPAWSPDGSAFAFTSENYQGLWVMQLGRSLPEKLSDEAAVGFGFAWADSGRAIVGRVARFERGRRFNALKMFYPMTKQSRQLTDFQKRMPGLPRWTANDEKIYCFDGKKLETFDSGLEDKDAEAVAFSTKLPYLKYGRIAVALADAKEPIIFDPIPHGRYINLVVSPDASKLAFEVVGGGLHVMNIDGTGLLDLGSGNRPQWSPDGTYLVYMIVKDDGHEFTESDLFTIGVDGTDKTQLTNNKAMLEMNPSWAPDGKTILFDAHREGAIYRIEVEGH